MLGGRLARLVEFCSLKTQLLVHLDLCLMASHLNQKKADQVLQEVAKENLLPLQIESSKNNGLLCTTGLTSQNVLDSGEGPRVEIEFHISNVFQSDEKGNLIDKKGFITISTDHWGGPVSAYCRPDFCNVIYQLADSAPINIPNRLGVFKPANVSFKFLADEEKAGITMIGQIAVAPAQSLAQSAFSGVSSIGERATGWFSTDRDRSAQESTQKWYGTGS